MIAFLGIDVSSDMSEQVNITSGSKLCNESHSPNSILFYYSSEKKCKYPEVSMASEFENAEMTEETPTVDGQVRQMCHIVVF